jgi:hypothetical protein
MGKKIVILALGMVLVAGAAGADNNKIGTAGAQELRIPIGARETAMGGAVISSVSGIEAFFWNPAGAVRGQRTEAFLSYRGYIADMSVSYFAVNSPMAFGTIGVSAKILSLGDIIVTTENDWDGTGEVYSVNVPVLGLTYSYALTDRVSFGATAMYVNEQVLQTKAQGVAFDFGFQYTPNWKTLRLGLVMKNYGPRMTFSGPDFEVHTHVPGDDPQAANRTLALTSANFELPSSFQIGGTYDLVLGEGSTGAIGVVFQSNAFSDDEWHFGAEFGLADKLFVRGGYVLSAQNDYIYGPSLGVGARFNLGSVTGTIDYSHVFVDKYFDDIPEVSLKFGL